MYCQSQTFHICSFPFNELRASQPQTHKSWNHEHEHPSRYSFKFSRVIAALLLTPTHRSMLCDRRRPGASIKTHSIEKSSTQKNSRHRRKKKPRKRGPTWMATRRLGFPTRLNPLHSLAWLVWTSSLKDSPRSTTIKPRLISLPWFPPPNPSSASEWVYRGFYSIFMFMAIYRLSRCCCCSSSCVVSFPPPVQRVNSRIQDT